MQLRAQVYANMMKFFYHFADGTSKKAATNAPQPPDLQDAAHAPRADVDFTDHVYAARRLVLDKAATAQALQVAENEGWKISASKRLPRRTPPPRPGVRHPLGSR